MNKCEQISNCVLKKQRALTPVGHSLRLCIEERKAWDQWNSKVVELYENMDTKLYISGCGTERAVSLTFDDAPDEKNTPLILDILRHHGVKASFSLVGVYVEELPHIAKRIFEEGHLIMNHTWKHFALESLNEEELEREVGQAEGKIFSVIGKKPALLRPPYGAVDERVVKWLERKGYTTILWSLNTFDWLETKKDSIIENVEKGVRPGEIILLHSYENKEPTVEALPEIIAMLKARGYRFLDVAEMLGVAPYL